MGDKPTAPLRAFSPAVDFFFRGQGQGAYFADMGWSIHLQASACHPIWEVGWGPSETQGCDFSNGWQVSERFIICRYIYYIYVDRYTKIWFKMAGRHHLQSKMDPNGIWLEIHYMHTCACKLSKISGSWLNAPCVYDMTSATLPPKLQFLQDFSGFITSGYKFTRPTF